MSARQLKKYWEIWFLLEGTLAFGRKMTENITYLKPRISRIARIFEWIRD